MSQWRTGEHATSALALEERAAGQRAGSNDPGSLRPWSSSRTPTKGDRGVARLAGLPGGLEQSGVPRGFCPSRWGGEVPPCEATQHRLHCF